jgi:hypothetical protein
VIEGFHLFDQFGNSVGVAGPRGIDWSLVDFSTFTPLEQSLLNRPDTVPLPTTAPGDVQVNPYPNPVNASSSIYLRSADSVKCKIIITDSKGTVLRDVAVRFKTAITLQLDLSDRNLFPYGKSLRYYYSFSVAGRPHFKAGFGDIKVCNFNGGQDVFTACFP